MEESSINCQPLLQIRDRKTYFFSFGAFSHPFDSVNLCGHGGHLTAHWPMHVPCAPVKSCPRAPLFNILIWQYSRTTRKKGL